MVIPKLCLWSLENGSGRKWSPGSMSAVVPRAVLIPQMTGFESKAWLVLPLPCVGFHPSTHCPCNGFRGTNSLSVSCSRAEQIAGFKSPTTHCYKSIKHLPLTIEPPASAAEHVNSCDQITAQLTAFTCAPSVPISKGEILAWLRPTGSWTVNRTQLFGRLAGAPCSLTSACAWAQGVCANVARWQQHLWLSLILHPHHGRASCTQMT